VNGTPRSARYMKFKPVRATNATVAVDRDKFVTNFELLSRNAFLSPTIQARILKSPTTPVASDSSRFHLREVR